MNVRHGEDESARQGRRHAHNLDVVHARLGLAMLMAERAMLRIVASVGLPALLSQHARSSRWTVTEIRAGVSGNAQLREEQSHRGQRADPPEPNPFHPERRRHTGTKDTRLRQGAQRQINARLENFVRGHWPTTLRDEYVGARESAIGCFAYFAARHLLTIF